MIGSSNFDNRSFELNYEITLAVVDSMLVGGLNAAFDDDLTRAREITLRDVRSRPLPARLRDQAAFLLREQL